MTIDAAFHLYLLDGDNLHFDGASTRELGRRYAKAMIELQNSGR